MQHEMQRRFALVKRTVARMRGVVALYLPIDPDMLRKLSHSRSVELEHVAQRNTVVLNDYVKPGDQLTLEMDQDTAQIRRIRIRTYLSSPGDVMTATVQYSQLSDGTFYPSTTTIETPGTDVDQHG
jgi:hypothetical protein